MKTSMFSFLLCFFGTISFFGNNNSTILSEDYWVKIKVRESGIYKLDFDSLKKWGFSNPDNISVFSTPLSSLGYKLTSPEFVEIPLQQINDSSGNYYRTYLAGVKEISELNGVKFYGLRSGDTYFNYYYIRQNKEFQHYHKIDSVKQKYNPELISKINGYNSYTLFDIDEGHNLKNGDFILQPELQYKDDEFNLGNIKNSVSFELNKRNLTDTIFFRFNDTTYSLIGDSNYSLSLPYKKIINEVSISCKNLQNELIIESFYLDVNLLNNHINQQHFFYFEESTRNNIFYNFTPPEVWFIYKNLTPRIYIPFQNDTSKSIIIQTDSVYHQIVTFDRGSYKLPIFDKVVLNQNLSELEPCNYLIICADSLFEPASRLSEIHKAYKDVFIKVVPQELIYNEYSCGRPEPRALYNYCRNEFKRSREANIPLQYLLLFGVANSETNKIETNFEVPALAPHNTGDNFIGSLSSDSISLIGDISLQQIDMAVGRIPAKTLTDATIYVNKVETHYRTLKKPNNEYLFIADNFEHSTSFSPADTVEILSNKLFGILKQKVIRKIFIDNEKEINLYNMHFKDNVNRGVGVIFYYGHSSQFGWNNNLMAKDDIAALKNHYFPLLLSFSCEFAKLSNENNISRDWLFTPLGGVLNIIGPTSITSIFNATSFYKNTIANWPEIYNKPAGDIFKSVINENYYKNFALLGDPLIQYSFAEDRSINIEINDYMVQGEITDTHGNRDFNFFGNVVMDVYNKPLELPSNLISPEYFLKLDSLHFSYTASVKNGVFTFDMPNGMMLNDYNMNLYAVSNKDSVEVNKYFTNLNTDISKTSFLELTIFPNPFSNNLCIKHNSILELPTQIEILSLDGKTVYSKKFSPISNKIQVFTSGLRNGVYTINITNEKINYTRIIIKN